MATRRTPRRMKVSGASSQRINALDSLSSPRSRNANVTLSALKAGIDALDTRRTADRGRRYMKLGPSLRR